MIGAYVAIFFAGMFPRKRMDEDVPFSNATYLSRYLAHRVFDKLWHGKHRLMSRNEAYTLGRQLLGWPSSQVLHISQLDAEQCQRLIEEVKAYRGTGKTKRTRAKKKSP